MAEIRFEADFVALKIYREVALWNNKDYNDTKEKEKALTNLSYDIVQLVVDNISEKSKVVIKKNKKKKK